MQRSPASSSPAQRSLAARAARFVATSAVSAALSFGLPVVLHEVSAVPVRAAVAAGFAASYLVNFLLLRSFVFRSANKALHDAPRYLVTNGALRLIEYGAFLALHEALHINYAVSIFLILATSTVVKFFAYQRLFGS